MNQVRLQHCPACRRWYAMARDRCGCGTPLVVAPVSGRGTVFSATVTHQAMTEEYAARVPYQTVLVELAEGPRVLALVDGPPLPLGAEVSVVDSAPAGADVPSTALLVERSRR